MIACPPGWHMELKGQSCVLRPPPRPDGRQVAEIRYSEGLHPMLSAAAVVEQVLSRQPAFTRLSQSPPELCITAEGEYAALVRVRGQLQRRAAWHLIAAIYGDDSMNVLDAVVSDREALQAISRTVRTLMYSERLGLGVRKRRFYFEPPPGWQALPSGLGCRFIPPDYPRQPATLVVHPATPRDSSEDAVLHSFIKTYQTRGFLVEALSDGEPVTADSGLHGKAWCLCGGFPGQPELTFDVLVLADARYLYALILESSPAALRAGLSAVMPAVARSVRPIPQAGGSVSGGSPSSLNHWSF